jgi:hypothetical protein
MKGDNMKSYFWDIETSTITCDNGEEIQVTYLSNILDYDLETCEYTSTFFRTLTDTVEYFKTLEEGFVFVHNLDYELTFLMRELDNPQFLLRRDKEGNYIKGLYGEPVTTSIFRDIHSPLSIQFEEFPQLTFRDTYALFNKSVEKLGEDLKKRGEDLPKLEYDYKKVRLPWDKLEDYDYKYNERDNLVVAYSLYYYMKDNNINDITKLPLTFTGAIRNQRKLFILENFGKKELKSYDYEYKKQFHSYDFFNLATRVYQGGLTTSLMQETGKFIERDMYSIDIKSSYPFQMCTKRYPCFYFNTTEYYKGNEANEHYQANKETWYMGSFNFINIRVKNDKYLLPISTSQIKKHNNKIAEQNIKLFNGKLISADNVLLHCNNIDIDTINLVYEYDYIICEEIYTTTKSRRLKESEIAFLLNCFDVKENTPKNTFEYNQAKSAINGQYGIKVTSPIRSSYYIENGELQEYDYYSYVDSDSRKQEIYNNFIEKETFNNMDIYTDGVYITSHARYMLVKKMCDLVNLGCTVVYADTDSLKFYTDNIEKVLQVLESENRNQIKRNMKNFRFKQYKERFNVSRETYDKLCRLGIWEIENKDNPYKLFVTYGAKKYAYLDNEGIHITIAGCNKKQPVKAMKLFAEKRGISLKDTMKLILLPNTRFDIEVSGRTTALYENRPKEELNYYTYQGRRVGQYGGIIIKDTTYTLGMSHNDSMLLGHIIQDDVTLTLNKEGEIY